MTTEPAATTTPQNPGTLLDAIGTALQAEHWTRLALRTPPSGMAAAAWTSPDRNTQLMITSAHGEPLMADITGHPAGHPATAVWSLNITDPSEHQIITAARAATEVQPDAPRPGTVRLGDVVRMVDRFQQAGWILHSDDARSGVLFRLNRADGRRVIIRTDEDADQPGGWMLEGHDLRADATDGTPTTVLAALAATAAMNSSHLATDSEGPRTRAAPQ